MTKIKHVKIEISPNIKLEPLTDESFCIGVIGHTPMDESGPIYTPKLSDELRKRIKTIRFAEDENSAKNNTPKNK